MAPPCLKPKPVFVGSVILLLVTSMGVLLIRGEEAGSSPDSGAATSRYLLPHVRNARPWEGVTLQDGSYLEYAGAFSADAKFRPASVFSRAVDSMLAKGAAGARPMQAPARMLRSYEGVVEAFEPPHHAVAVPQTHSIAGRTGDALATLVYGHQKVLARPQNVITDSLRRVIISDPVIPAVHVLDPSGKGSFRIVGGEGRWLQSPGDIAVDDSDNIYVADTARATVLVYSPDGRFLREIGTFHGESLFAEVSGIAIDRKLGHLYVADGASNVLFLLDLEGNILTEAGQNWTVAPGGPLKARDRAGAGLFDSPKDLALGEKELLVLDKRGTRVSVLDLQCHLVGSFMVQHAAGDEADSVAMDTDGHIYVSYGGNAEIRVFDRNGKLLAFFGQRGFRTGEFGSPKGVWIDSSHRVYVADAENARVEVFQLTNGAPVSAPTVPHDGAAGLATSYRK